jgi:hypothetical protein
MAKILILVILLLIGYGVAWSGGWVRVKSDSRIQWVMDRVQLTAIALVTLILLTLPALTSFQGTPAVAYVSAVVLVAALPLFSLKMRYPVNVLTPAKGARAKALPEQPRLSRWPFSLAWTIGYVLAGWYLATIYGQFG